VLLNKIPVWFFFIATIECTQEDGGSARKSGRARVYL